MDKTNLYKLYIKDWLSTTHIWKIYWCSHHKIRRLLKLYWIRIRSAWFRKNNKFWYKPCKKETKIKISKANSWDKNWQWKWGVYIKEWYLTIKQKNNPRADKIGRVKYHVYVVEKYIGRNLEPYQCVHHIDGDKLNNNLDNLYIFPTYWEHSSYHNKHKDWNWKWALTSNLSDFLSIDSSLPTSS